MLFAALNSFFEWLSLCENSKRIKHHYLNIKNEPLWTRVRVRDFVMAGLRLKVWQGGRVWQAGLLRPPPSVADVEMPLAVAVAADLTWGWGALCVAAKKEQSLSTQALSRLQCVTIASQSRHWVWPGCMIGRPKEVTEWRGGNGWVKRAGGWKSPSGQRGESTCKVPVAGKPQPVPNWGRATLGARRRQLGMRW